MLLLYILTGTRSTSMLKEKFTGDLPPDDLIVVYVRSRENELFRYIYLVEAVIMLIELSDVHVKGRIIHFLDVSKRNSLWNSIKQASILS